MDLARLLLLLSLTASAAALTLAAQSDPGPAACDLGSSLLSPTAQCSKALVALASVPVPVPVPAQQEVAIPCLCRAAADPHFMAASFDDPGCGKDNFRGGLDLADWYCEGYKATALCGAATRLATKTKVSRFCPIDKRIEECSMAVARVPCLCCVEAEPELAAASFNVTGILAGPCGCGASYLADACKGWQLPAPAHQGANKTAAIAASCTPKAVWMVTCVRRDPTVQSCKELVAYVDLRLRGGVPCLCRARAAVEFVTIIAKATDLLEIYYNACGGGGLRLGGADHKAAAAAAAPFEWYGLPPQQQQQHLYRGRGKAVLFANSYCEVEETRDRATAMRHAASLATRLSRFCVLHKCTAECCMATVGPSGRPPCLCRVGVAAQPQLAGVLELYAGTCGGRHLVGADECKDWHLPAPVLTHQGATTAPTVAALLSDRTVRSCKDLVASVDIGGVVPYLCHTAVENVIVNAGLKATDLLAIYNASGGLPLGGAHHKAAAASCEGTIMTTSNDRLKPSPLPPDCCWKLAEIFTTGVLLGIYLAIITVIFFWATYKVHIRFIIIGGIIIIGVLFSTMHTVQAAPPVQDETLDVQVELDFEGRGYFQWSGDLHVLWTSFSKYEARRAVRTLKVLSQQAAAGRKPPAWINVTVVNRSEWSKFTVRNDNGYVSQYQNSQAAHAFTETTHLHPDSLDIGFAGSYRGLNGGRRNLTQIDFNERTAKRALKVLSRYRHGVDDPFEMRRALTMYIIIISEAQRFTEVDECLKDGWKSNCRLKRPNLLFVNFEVLSCGVLEDWEPNLRHHYNDRQWVDNRRWTYHIALKKLGITERQAPRLLRVLLLGKACQRNARMSRIRGSSASWSTRT